MAPHKCTFTPGIHSALIESIILARDHKGNPLVNQHGEITIEVVYTGANGATGYEIIPYGEKTQYLTDALAKACMVDNRVEDVDVKELIGKRIWIYVRGVYQLGDDPAEALPLHTEIISGKYSQFHGPKPASIEAPEYNNGVPTGMFVEFVNINRSMVNLEEREFGDD